MKSKRSLSPALLLAIPLASPLSAQTPSGHVGPGPEARRVDSVFAAFDNTRSPGCAVGAWQEGDVLLERGYGMANLEHGVPITPSTVFRIGSVSKQFTAAAVLLLAGDDSLSLGDPARKWVPEFPQYEGRPITLRHLLHHTSGVRDYLGLMRLAGKRPGDYFTDEEVLEVIARQEGLNFEPGTEYSYSNSEYFLLGKVVEAASGQSLRAFARDRMFEPLGMEQSHFHDRPNHLVPGRATGYEPTGGGEYRRDVTNLPMVGDGSVFTSVRDFLRWDANLSHPKIGGEDFGERMTRRGVLSPGDTIDYASGLFVRSYRGLRQVRHGGAFVGYRAAMMRFPEQGFSAVVLCDRSDVGPVEKLTDVAEIYFSSKMEPKPDAKKPAAEGPVPTEHEIATYAGLYRSEDGYYREFRDTEEDTLSLISGNGRDRLKPVGPAQFTLAEAARTFAFQTDESAPPARVTEVRADDTLRVYRRVERAERSTETLAALEGTYYSPELGVEYRILQDDGTLEMARGPRDPEPLRPGIEGEFRFGRQGVIRFAQAEADAAPGFTFKTGRVEGIRFERRP